MTKMKTILSSFLAAATLLVLTTGCSSDDTTPSTVDVAAQEQSLVGLWWDEFEYSDVTEQGVPFSRVLLAVKADADHTGCIYLGVFGPTGYDPLAVYGGPDEAPFTWRLQDDGRLLLGDPATGETYALSRSGDDGSYGHNMTDVSTTSMTYTDGSMTVTNPNYSGTLVKVDSDKESEIEQALKIVVADVNSGDTGIGVSGTGSGAARARRHGGEKQ